MALPSNPTLGTQVTESCTTGCNGDLTLDFASEFVPLIWHGQKTATTRVLIEEPALAALSVGSEVKATCASHGGSRVFATLLITAIEDRTFNSLDDTLARLEHIDDSRGLQAVLRRFYPNVKSHDVVHVFYFRQVARHCMKVMPPPLCTCATDKASK